MENPFAALVQECNEENQKLKVSAAIEAIFEFTMNPSKKQLLQLDMSPVDLSSDKASQRHQYLFDFELLKQALFERILMSNPASSDGSRTFEPQAITYLAACWCTYKLQFSRDASLDAIGDIIIENVYTALKNRELFEGQDLNRQFYQVVHSPDFFEKVYQRFAVEKEQEGPDFKTIFTAVLDYIQQEIKNEGSFHKFPHEDSTALLMIYANYEPLSLLLMEKCMPGPKGFKGRDYESTLLGLILSMSILPKQRYQKFEYFKEMQGNELYRNNLWSNISAYQNTLYNLMLKLIRCSLDVRTKVLAWIGACLSANEARSQVANQMNLLLELDKPVVSDGFMLNLCCIMARLVQPICNMTKDNKILSVDPTYCSLSAEQIAEQGYYLSGLSKETCLLPTQETRDDGTIFHQRPVATQRYSFATEMFFLTHRAFELGFKLLTGKLTQTMRSYQRLITNQQETQDPHVRQIVADVFCKIESMKCVLGEPDFFECALRFASATCYWLTQVALDDKGSDNTCSPEKPCLPFYYPETQRKFDYDMLHDLTRDAPDTLRCVPEFVIENVSAIMEFYLDSYEYVCIPIEISYLEQYMNVILTFMGSSKYLKNPHLRASLAARLQSILPNDSGVTGLSKPAACTQIFDTYNFRHKIIESLLNVFVSIEMTGESVQFELKFGYRRPMYAIMGYLWKRVEYRMDFEELARQAEANIEKSPPPLFLRFINLLINDAIYLLDEALANMSKLKELEARSESPDFDNLSSTEQEQIRDSTEHFGHLARFGNILGNDTIQMLKKLTSQIVIVFTHKTMVDRMAAMLNYFLLKLVGPTRTEFKVKNMAVTYNFKPAATVRNICEIYVNLRESDAFCLAISQDGRSYTPELFELAEQVLGKIEDGGRLLGDVRDLALRVLKRAAEQKTTDDMLGEIPESFLDPIMSTLMTDPVMLPSSRMTVDRQTIARHLLSDQTDPFNRSLLTMEAVVPNVDLRNEIEEWLREKKAASAASVS